MAYFRPVPEQRPDGTTVYRAPTPAEKESIKAGGAQAAHQVYSGGGAATAIEAPNPQKTSQAYGGPTTDATQQQRMLARSTGMDYYAGGTRYSSAGEALERPVNERLTERQARMLDTFRAQGKDALALPGGAVQVNSINAAGQAQKQIYGTEWVSQEPGNYGTPTGAYTAQQAVRYSGPASAQFQEGFEEHLSPNVVKQLNDDQIGIYKDIDHVSEKDLNSWRVNQGVNGEHNNLANFYNPLQSGYNSSLDFPSNQSLQVASAEKGAIDIFTEQGAIIYETDPFLTRLRKTAYNFDLLAGASFGNVVSSAVKHPVQTGITITAFFAGGAILSTGLKALGMAPALANTVSGTTILAGFLGYQELSEPGSVISVPGAISTGVQLGTFQLAFSGVRTMAKVPKFSILEVKAETGTGMEPITTELPKTEPIGAKPEIKPIDIAPRPAPPKPDFLYDVKPAKIMPEPVKGLELAKPKQIPKSQPGLDILPGKAPSKGADFKGVDIVSGKPLNTGTRKGSIEYEELGIQEGNILRPEPKTPKKIFSVGLNFGSHGQPLIVVTTYNHGMPDVVFGTPNYANRVPISSITEAKGLPMPETAAEGKIFRRVYDFSPAEQQRIDEVIRINRILGRDKGLRVGQFVEVNVKGIKNPKAVTPLIEDFVLEGKGKVYGSFISAPKGQLPEPWTTKSPGDIDVMFKNLKVEEIKPRLEGLTKALQDLGEDVELSPKNDNIIQFRSGEKFLEAKSGINQETLGLDDLAPEAYLGFNLETGRTVKFGKARAITAGEQLMRKGAGTLIVSPGKLPGETASFSVPGILGKQGNPRGLKDVAGFMQGGYGLSDIRAGSWNPVKRFGGERAKAAMDRFLETYTPEQQSDILGKLYEKTGYELGAGKEAPKMPELSGYSFGGSLGSKGFSAYSDIEESLFSFSSAASGSPGRSASSASASSISSYSFLSDFTSPSPSHSPSKSGSPGSPGSPSRGGSPGSPSSLFSDYGSPGSPRSPSPSRSGSPGSPGSPSIIPVPPESPRSFIPPKGDLMFAFPKSKPVKFGYFYKERNFFDFSRPSRRR